MLAMNRRAFLQAAGYTSLSSSLVGSLFQEAEAMTPAQVAGPDADLHLLRRISFGPTDTALARVRRIGRAAYIEEQLGARDAATGLLAAALYPRIDTAGSGIYLTSLTGGNPEGHILDLQSAMLYKALFSSAQLYEVMVDFWNDHFNTYIRKNVVPLKIDFDRGAIRPNAMGNFKTLLKKTVRSADMLHYLDNWLNRKGQINENYARELLELHTMGKGNYGEADMKALSRILSGLGYIVDLPLAVALYGTVQFNAAQHDTSAKTFLGQNFPAGGGEAEIDRALNLILDHPATAKYIAGKLCARFVSDTPPAALVTAVAATFTATGGDIKAMLRQILNSTEFAASAGAKLKRPQHAMIGAMRACGINRVDHLVNTELFGVPVANPAGLLYTSLGKAGHAPFMWAAPNGYPDSADYWGNTNSMLYQQKYLVKLVEGVSYSYILARPLAALQGSNSVAGSVTRARTPRQAVDNACANLLFQALPASVTSLAVSFVAQGAAPDAVMDPALLEQRVKGLVFALLASPWFLLR
ncbi:DUF1800 domain-containing protein [Solimonas sp. K1W22B-7]|uniref:DUF1800 domain-containing protein n=1 Tax=Solimonas sp. K1W22B-7 TaxID=2303331 RepID=UPI0013C43E3F|nr:DUF1800 domain-containing protein [Solimonas sp. K1W22B-7]